MEREELEAAACTPHIIYPDGFNHNAVIPYGCTTEHIRLAMNEFLSFLGFINRQLHSQGLNRLESLVMPATFSGIVGEFVANSIPKYSKGLVRNRYPNGHPDMIPIGKFPRNSVRYAHDGIEIKGSRRPSGWQGHNPENIWLMVFVFDSNSAEDLNQEEIEVTEKQTSIVFPKPFRFVKVVGERLALEDWSFSGRSGVSRRTITASVLKSGYNKMEANWIYRDPEYAPHSPIRRRRA